MSVTIVPQTVLLGGVTKATLVAAEATGNDFDNDSKTYVEIANADASTTDVTVVGQRNLPTGQSATKVITVPIAGSRLIGPFPAGIFSRDSDGHVLLTFEKVTALTIAVFSLNDGFN